MERFQAFKFELIPDSSQRRALFCFAGACRFVFNKALNCQIARHANGQKRLGYGELCRLLTTWRHSSETAWLSQAPTHPLQQALKDLECAYGNFFAKRAGFPRFKKKGRHENFRYPDRKQIKLDEANNRIYLPKLGWLRFRNSRAVLGSVLNATVSFQAGRWYVAIQTVREMSDGLVCGAMVGIDMGIVRFATMSDGSFKAPLNSFRQHEVRLRKAQQSLSRKVKYSNNWNRAKERVQLVHARIANARRDFLHKATSTICNNHAIVCIEDLKVKNMARSAKGSSATPGHRVRAKSGLNKAILDQGWCEFRRQLAYKLAWKGGWLIAVPPHHTSQTCPDCGHVSALSRRTQEDFACIACGYRGHADVVAAINVLRRGQSLMCKEGRDNARFACEVNGAARPSAAGTHLSDIDQLYAGENAGGISFHLV